MNSDSVAPVWCDGVKIRAVQKPQEGTLTSCWPAGVGGSKKNFLEEMMSSLGLGFCRQKIETRLVEVGERGDQLQQIGQGVEEFTPGFSLLC